MTAHHEIAATVGVVRARTAPLADRAAHAAAEALGQAWFGPNFDEACFDAWAGRIAQLLFVAEDTRSGAFVGYADQMFLASDTERALREGTVAEEQFDAHSVLDDGDLLALPTGTSVTLYLAGMCVTQPGSDTGRDAARALRACRRTLVQQWQQRGLQVLMLMAAATEAGQRIAARAGGRLVSPAHLRADGYDLFELASLPDD